MHSSWNAGMVGVLEVLGKFFQGGYLSLPENVGGSLIFVLLHFYDKIFQTLPPVCIFLSMTHYIKHFELNL